jgi:outer membrane protein OmpA-like peptidoglycan-associated protein
MEGLAKEIQRNFSQLNSVAVTVHTDRVGAETDGAALAQERADTVRELLMRQGLDGAVIRSVGVADRKPVVQCGGTERTQSLVRCLQANRRVELEITAQP